MAPHLSLSILKEMLFLKTKFNVTSKEVVLNKKSFQFKIVLPPLEEQKAIANILSSLDEKIELNNQMNKTLEEMAQALFKTAYEVVVYPVTRKVIQNVKALDDY